jgi:hypothetical protein
MYDVEVQSTLLARCFTLLHKRARHDLKARIKKRQIIWPGLSISQGRMRFVSLMDAISVRAFLWGCKIYHLYSRSSPLLRRATL